LAYVEHRAPSRNLMSEDDRQNLRQNKLTPGGIKGSNVCTTWRSKLSNEAGIGYNSAAGLELWSQPKVTGVYI
jgi:hypothetical protein